MVLEGFKKVGRLILAVLLLCGVGLFLIGNTDVKADASVSGNNLSVPLNNTSSDNWNISKVTLKLGASTHDITVSKTVAAGSTGSIDIATKDIPASFLNAAGVINISITADKSIPDITGPAVKKIEVKMASGATEYEYATGIGTTLPSTTKITLGGGRTYTGSTAYGFEKESYSVACSDESKYYEYISTTPVQWYKFGKSEGVVGATDLTLKAQFFPKITAIKVGNADYHIPSTGAASGVNVDIPFTVLNGTTELTGTDLATVLANVSFLPTATTSNVTVSSVQPSQSADKKPYLKVTGHKDTNNASNTVTVGMKTGYIDGNSFKSDNSINAIEDGASVTKGTATIYAYATGWGLGASTSISTSTKTSTSAAVTFSPKAADQDPSYYGITKDSFSLASGASNYIENATYAYDATKKEGTFSFKSKSKKGSTSVSLASGKYSNGALSNSVTISISKETSDVYVDAEESVTKINKSDKNYITVGYELNLNDLVKNNLVNDEGKAVSASKAPAIDEITVEDDSNVEVGSGFKLKGKKEGKVTIDVALEDGTTLEGVIVYVYPMPSIKYNSDHTVKATVPSKVSTGYGDTDTNLAAGKGFKLQMIDGSGNVLYEYDKTRYQTVISTVQNYSSDYTVTAADIEGMVTSAGSNGKFSADTTSVKFRIVPMGYKQTTTSEVVVAKDEVKAESDAATVYKISATGDNFTASAAYGLDGQSVNLTATPATGFTFAQWSDGDKSNPRKVTVAASGQRSFTAQATAGGSAAGGGYDDVPKTAESNSAIWLIVFMVFAVMGTGYALYLQLTAATSKNGK